MKSAPYIATELLEIVIDELGAEAETLPSSSAAFQALLSLSLTGPRAQPRCEQYLFSTLTFDNAEHKERPNANPAWIRLQATLELFEAKPHLASYVRHLKISFYRAFPSHRTVGTLSSASNRLESAQEYAEAMLPQVLIQLLDVISFSFDARGYTLGAIYDWFNLPPRIRKSIVAFLARSIEEGHLLQELCLSSFKRMPADIFDSHGIGWFFPEQWTFVLTELECEGHYAFLQTLLQYESGKHLSNLQKLSCSIQRTLETIVLGWVVSACGSSLRSLDISVHGEDEGVLRNIRGKVQLPHLRSLSLTADVEGYSKTIPRLVKNLASRGPNLQSVAIHAVWSTGEWTYRAHHFSYPHDADGKHWMKPLRYWPHFRR